MARLGVAGGYSEKSNVFFDVVLGLGAGYTIGDFTVMGLAMMTWDQDSGAEAPGLQIPNGLSLGPELHAQAWLTRSVALDLSAARVFRLIGGNDDPVKDVSAETRLSAALLIVGGGSGLGVSLGGSFVDYGIGRGLAANLALRWGAR